MKEFSNLGEEIRHTVQDAVDTMNFDHLNKNISDSVNSALNEVRSRLNIDSMNTDRLSQNIRDWKVSYHGTQNKENDQTQNRQNNTKYYQTTDEKNQSNYNGQSNAQSQADLWEKRKQAAIERANQMRRNQSYRQNANFNYQKQQSYQSDRNALIPCPRKVPGRIAGPVLKGIGYTFGFMTGLTTLILGIVFFSTHDSDVFLATQILGSIFAVNLTIALSGKRISNRVKRYRQYITYMANRKFCQIEALSAHTGYSKKFILKDLRKMLQLGMFPQAHLDDKATCLILDHETYQQYLQANSEFERKKRLEEEEGKRKQKEPTQKVNDNSPEAVELRKTINEGRAYIHQIKEANDAIPDIDISDKLSRLEQITSKIFTFVEQHPEQLPELRKFMEYYLPITLKLVNAYKELDEQPVQGDNIRKSKNEIVSTLDTINFAFENLLDSLYESTAMDVSSDISVLEALFAQDGLTKKDFDINK